MVNMQARRPWPLAAQLMIAAVIVTLAAPFVACGSLWIGLGAYEALTESSRDAAVETYVRNHASIVEDLQKRPGIYRVELIPQTDQVRIEGLVEDQKRFSEVEAAFDDAWALPHAPYLDVVIRNGEERPQNLGYMAEGAGEAVKALLLFAGALLAAWIVPLLLSVAWLIYRRFRYVRSLNDRSASRPLDVEAEMAARPNPT